MYRCCWEKIDVGHSWDVKVKSAEQGASMQKINCHYAKTKKENSDIPQLIEWNGYETRQTPLLYVFVDLKVHNVQKNSYHFDCIDQ